MNEMEDPKPANASTTQAPTLEDDIRELGRKIISLGDKIVAIGDKKIAPLIGVAGKEAELAEWKDQQAELKEREKELKEREKELKAQVGPKVQSQGSKRLRFIGVAENNVGFLSFAPELALPRTLPEANGALEFLSPLWNTKETTTRSLLVRQCYVSLFDELDPMSQPGFVGRGEAGAGVIGTPGSGKSGFGLYAAIRFAETRAVVYQHKDDTVLIVSCDAALQAASNAFGSQVMKKGVYTLEGGMVPKDLLQIKGLVHVADPKTGQVMDTIGIFTLVVSSPDMTKLSTFFKGLTVQRVMPSWTLEEIKLIAPSHTPRLDSDELERLVDFFGGVPRAIFGGPGYMGLVNKAVNEARLEDLQRAVLDILPSSKGDLSPLLIHTVPDTESPDSSVRMIASNAISKRIVKAFMARSKQDFEVFFAAVSRNPRLQQLRGFALEQMAHEILIKGGTFKVAKLGDGTAPLVWEDKEFPALKLVEFSRNNMVDLLVLLPNQLAVPMASNFPSLDSFSAMDWEAVMSCVGFQVTVGQSHDVGGPGLKNVLKKTSLLVKGGTTLPQVLVFVTTTTGIVKRQKITKAKSGKKKERAEDDEEEGDEAGTEEYAKGGFGDKLPQFALLIGDVFEKFLEKFEQ